MILLIDNYDSFTFNVAQALGELGQECHVVRNDRITIDEIRELGPKALVISPGPGRPEDAGITLRAIEAFAGLLPILGICLGHQALAMALGGKVTRGKIPVHGKCSEIYHDGKTIFRGLRNPFLATRYHSLVVPEESLPDQLKTSAFTLDGELMGIRSRDLALEGVQFHPESIATADGLNIFRNFLETYVGPVTAGLNRPQPSAFTRNEPRNQKVTAPIFA